MIGSAEEVEILEGLRDVMSDMPSIEDISEYLQVYVFYADKRSLQVSAEITVRTSRQARQKHQRPLSFAKL